MTLSSEKVLQKISRISSFNHQKKSSLRAYILLIRPGNLIITLASVFIAGIISSVNWQEYWFKLAIAAVSAAFIAAGGNAFNDYCDRELDHHQKAHRPIPAGKISPVAALKWTGLCLISGLLLSILVNVTTLLIASWAVFLLLFYSQYWKRIPVVGNVTVAFVAGLAFIYGGAAVQNIGTAFWAACLAFLFHLGREIIKDMEDQQGDKAAGVTTLPVKYGLKAGSWGVLVSFVLLVIFLPLPYLLGDFRIPYLYLSLFGVFPVLALAIVWIWRWIEPHHLHRLNLLLKLDMIVGLSALYFGRPLLNPAPF